MISEQVGGTLQTVGFPTASNKAVSYFDKKEIKQVVIQKFTPPETNDLAAWKLMLGRFRFLLGPIFSVAMFVSVREDVIWISWMLGSQGWRKKHS